MPEYPTLLHRWFEEVWNQKNAAAIREMFTEDTLVYGLSGPGGPAVRGFEDFERYHADLIGAFPDIQVVVEDVIQQDNKIGGRFTVTGTQTGDLPNLPATGKKVKFTGSGIATVKEGRFEEVWNEVDFSKMEYDLAPDTPDVS